MRLERWSVSPDERQSETDNDADEEREDRVEADGPGAPARITRTAFRAVAELTKPLVCAQRSIIFYLVTSEHIFPVRYYRSIRS